MRTRLGSTLMGTSPSRWLSTSSWTIDVLLYMKTSSIATAGTSLTRTRRRALAIEASRPTRSNEMVEDESELIVICRDWRGVRRELGASGRDRTGRGRRGEGGVVQVSILDWMKVAARDLLLFDLLPSAGPSQFNLPARLAHASLAPS
jgi:hypothetical protein